ncbi:hypothetical protein R6Q59_005867 [Mikania micrantha]
MTLLKQLFYGGRVSDGFKTDFEGTQNLHKDPPTYCKVRLGLKGLMADQVLEGSSQPVDLSKHPSGILPILHFCRFLRCLFMIISTPSTKSAPTTATTTTKRMIFASSDNSKPAKIPKLSPDNNIKPIYVQITQFVRVC